jgi:hypothetical protein
MFRGEALDIISRELDIIAERLKAGKKHLPKAVLKI